MGDVITDAIRNFPGYFQFAMRSQWLNATVGNGPFRPSGNEPNIAFAGFGELSTGNNQIYFDPSLAVPTADENRPVSVSYLPCVTY